jgi:hypothetical protein
MSTHDDPLYIPAPEREVPKKGMHAAVCAFVEDIGLQVSAFASERTGEKKVQPRAVICWELAEKMKDGRPFMLSKTFVLSTHPKSNLVKTLNGWLEEPPSTEDMLRQRFNLRSLIGEQAAVQVVHVTREDGSVRAKLEAVFPPQDGAEPLEVFNAAPPEWIERQRVEGREDVAIHEAGGERKGEAGGGKFDAIPF